MMIRYRIVTWEGTSGGHLIQSHLLKQGHPQPVAQDYVQMATEYLKGWRN